jgi:peptidoglycan hydrolase CwlO-like protein
MTYKIKTDWDYTFSTDLEYLKGEVKELEEEIKAEEESIRSNQEFLFGDKIRLGALYKRLVELNQN